MVSSNMTSNPSNYFVHTLLRARDWQHRPEFDRVCEWWRTGGQGVCGLVGMGGAGKTAIVDRLLQVLPGVMLPNPRLPKDNTLPAPNSTVVFSFYDAPNAEAFFEALSIWLSGAPNGATAVSYSQLIFRMQNAVPGLIVLDGLEKVQEDGTRGILGRIDAPNLRDFVNRAANGYFPRLSVLLTTRFPLADLQEEQPPFFQSIPIEEIDTSMGINLLRQRGVRGRDLQLEHIVKECGCHALTVDLAGGYIKEYGKGDPDTPLALGAAIELEQAVEQEQDPTKRAVLKQGFRFARVAQRYQAAMLEHDPAALALLERICLFRLGVDATTLAAIFTGEAAVPVSGAALAGLSAQQLQRKLDWLVQMRIIEETRVQSRDRTTRILYNIHPAVRDGFVQGIGRDIAALSHQAIRTGLEVSLGKTPGENPSDPATLDLLEEIVYHAIASGQVQEAYKIHRDKIGGHQNLGWRLGAYERGERICRAFGGAQSPETIAALLRDPHRLAKTFLPCLPLSDADRAVFINEWGLYLQALGRLDAAARCCEAHIDMRMRQENWQNASRGNQNLSGVWLLAGRLRLALASAEEALRLAEQADSNERRYQSFILLSQSHTALGKPRETLNHFADCQRLWGTAPLDSSLGNAYSIFLSLMGRRQEATRFCEGNKRRCRDRWGEADEFSPIADLILADLWLSAGTVQSARDCYRQAYDWALAREAKDVLCRAALVKARIELAEARSQESGVRAEPLQAAQNALMEGLKLAVDCGYGIHHIDLLLEQTHLHLFLGKPQAALADLHLALDGGIPANDQIGQPELLAAHDPECGYAWGIALGLHRRAEALLLQAAHTLGTDSFAPARRKTLPATVQTLMTQAEACLTAAMICWHDLRDPEVQDSNFIHPTTDEAYNYRAAETYRVLNDLQGGLLTQYPLPSRTDTTTPEPLSPSELLMTKRFNVALSFPGEHRPFVAAIADVLAQTLTKPRVFYDRFYEAELARPNLDIYLQRIYHDDADLIVVFLCEDYNNKEWCHLEARAIRDLIKQRRDEEIMFVRVDNGKVDGVFSVDGYVNAHDRPASEIAQLICERLQRVQAG